ncbi:MAG: heparinase II/III family protein, partial [Oscillospiraceae bacterium]|nr:heparinase II/III family protein [Oscillospiraceae bacterium]
MKKSLSLLLLLLFLTSLLLPGLLPKAEAAYSTEATPSATASEIDELFLSRSQGVHPRILATDEDFLRIRKNIEENDYLRTVYARLYRYCLEQLNEPVCVYELPDGVRLLDISKKASQRITWMAMLYKITGEARFADRAIEEMLAVCAFPDWHPKHYLDVGQMAYGVGLGYDWLYYELTAAERKTISSALYNYAVATSPGQWYKTLNSNWNPWCHGGVTIAACAIYEDYPTRCAEFLSGAVTDIQKSLEVFAPMGAYPEGPGYSQVGTLFSALMFESFETVLGSDFGLSDMEGFKESGKYLSAMTGYVNSFNYGDGSDKILDGAVHHWFAKRYNMPELSLYQMEVQTYSWDEHLELLWFDPELVESVDGSSRQLDYLMYSNEGQSIASFRSEKEDAYQIYAAIKGGYNSTSHADMDVGTFVMEAMGVRWFTDLGSDNYNLSGYGTYNAQTGYAEDIGRWTYYRKRAEGQNTLVINPSTKGGQSSHALCQITDFKSGYDGGHAVVDMLNAYEPYGATSVKRGISLFDNRSRVMLRDEITCSSSSEIYWFAHTKAEISISSDGKTAELTQDGKTLLATIVEPSNGKFTAMTAEPLSTSPNPSGQYDRSAFRKLAIHLENVKSANITVVFTPVASQADRSKTSSAVALSDFGTLTASCKPGTTLKENNGVYEIYTAEELIRFSEMVNGGNNFAGKTVKLMADIDLGNRSIAPIGGGTTRKVFKGTFDGNYHVVKNLCIFEPGQGYIGFFGEVGSATIKNFGIESGIVFGGQKSGGLIGLANNVNLDNCFNKARVIGNGAHIGGIVGQLGGNSTITNCYNNANVRNSSSVTGGLAGYISSSANIAIQNCYHAGTLEDSKSRCGMIGFYNTTDLSYAPASVSVRNSFSITPLKCAEMVTLSDVEDYTDSAQLSKEQLVAKAVNLGAAFMDDCEQTNGGYPVFSWQCKTTLPGDLVLTSASELRLLAYMVNSGKNSFKGKTVKLGQNIDLDSRLFIPIGGNMPSDSGAKYFNGTFDGQGYTIKNLRVVTNNYYVGFFGSVTGTIRNLGIESGSIKGRDKVGGITGYLNGTMTNCYNKATVKGSNFTGGLIGMSAKSTITNSYNAGSVTASNMAGGLVGYYSSAGAGSVVTGCYNAGTLSGKQPGQFAANMNSAVTNITYVNTYGLGTPLVGNTDAYILTSGGTITEADLKTSAKTLGSAFTHDSATPTNKGYPIVNIFLYHIAETPTLTKDSDGVYHIKNAEDLYAFAYLVNVEKQRFSGQTVVLDADIDLMNRPWVSIGGNTTYDDPDNPYFSGSFKGQGHRIYNLCVNSRNWYTGLFGYVQGGTIDSVGVESGMVFGAQKTAGLVGCARSSKITNCYNRTNVNGTSLVGGIVGMLNSASNRIENCYNTGSVGANGTYGGIIGYYAGGTQNSTVKNCYNTGHTNGGLVGVVNAGATGNTIENSYTTAGNALVAEQNSLTVTNCGQITPAELRGLSATLGSGYREDYLVMNRLRPVLAWENAGCKSALPQKDGVYEISNAEELRLLSYLVRKGNTFSGKQIILKSDIDLENKPWLPIGGNDESKGYAFRGTFDGRGYVVRNMISIELENSYSGLFGYVSQGTVKNVGLESGISLAKDKAAGLVAYLQNGAKLQNSYTRATVFANNISGGLVAMVGGNNCLVENCYNTGFVSGKSFTNTTAGLVAYLSGNTKGMILRNCYNVGNYYGILGEPNAGATENTVSNTYTVGNVQLYYIPRTLVSQSVARLSSDSLKGYAAVLGSAFDNDSKGVNDSYPVLTWQSGKSCFHEYDMGKITTAPTLTTKGVKTYTCQRDSSHTYTEAVEPLAKSLFFDFNNDTASQSRYQNYVYNFTSFDQIGAWRGRTQGLVDGSASMDLTKGLLTVKPGTTGYGSIYADSV